MIGMGASDKLHSSGPDRYNYAETARLPVPALGCTGSRRQCRTRAARLGGSVLGFDWANQHRDRIQGIAFMEASVSPISWSEFPPDLRGVFEGLRSAQGEAMVLEQNMFVEHVLPAAMQRKLSGEEMDHYRQPFVPRGGVPPADVVLATQHSNRREPAEVTAVVNDYSSRLAGNEVPKLFINAEPRPSSIASRTESLRVCMGDFMDLADRYGIPPQVGRIRAWPNLTETTVSGLHFVQEDSPDEIGTAIAQFVRKLRST